MRKINLFLVPFPFAFENCWPCGHLGALYNIQENSILSNLENSIIPNLLSVVGVARKLVKKEVHLRRQNIFPNIILILHAILTTNNFFWILSKFRSISTSLFHICRYKHKDQ
jgi:hypothetical protein